jgi:hypothetical protein
MVETEELKQQLKGKKQRSTKYPNYSLQNAIEYASVIYQVGGREFAPVNSILYAIGINSKSNHRYNYLTSSASQFGLIVVSSEGLKITETCLRILYPPEGEIEKKKLLIKAFNTPKFYQKIIRRYSNLNLPPDEQLKNLFINEGIAPNVADQALKAFLESAKFAGILGPNRQLNIETENDEGAVLPSSTQAQPVEVNHMSSLINSPPPPIPSDEGAQSNGVAESNLPGEVTQLMVDKPSPQLNPQIPAGCSDKYQRIEYVMSSGEKAVLEIPKNAMKGDIEKIKRLLDTFAE